LAAALILTLPAGPLATGFSASAAGADSAAAFFSFSLSFFF